MKTIDFAPYNSFGKAICPRCGKNRFTRLWNPQTGNLYPSEYGVCDRINSCCYKLHPGSAAKPAVINFSRPEPKRAVDYLNISEVEKRESNNAPNDFFNFLENVLGREAFQKVKKYYRLGTSLEFTGMVSFSQIDQMGRLRQIKEMAYNPKTGKRLKSGRSFNWVFSKKKYPNLNLEICFFGEHLLADNDRAVAVVESEKTALIASVAYPNYIWMATGSEGTLTNERCKSLINREVVLFPDIGKSFGKWKRKAKYIKGMKSITVNDYLETNKEKYELKEGEDLADLILKLNQ